MGWKEGNGLGKRQHGRTEAIKTAKKQDQSGIGAQALAQTDPWLQNTAMYESILSKLNQNTSSTKEGDAVFKTLKKKKSKTTTRMHSRHKYQKAKATRHYSSSDMAAILGTPKPSTSQEEEEETGEKCEEAATPNTIEMTYTESAFVLEEQSTSVNDYFQTKMQALVMRKHGKYPPPREMTVEDVRSTSKTFGSKMKIPKHPK